MKQHIKNALSNGGWIFFIFLFFALRFAYKSEFNGVIDLGDTIAALLMLIAYWVVRICGNRKLELLLHHYYFELLTKLTGVEDKTNQD